MPEKAAAPLDKFDGLEDDCLEGTLACGPGLVSAAYIRETALDLFPLGGAGPVITVDSCVITEPTIKTFIDVIAEADTLIAADETAEVKRLKPQRQLRARIVGWLLSCLLEGGAGRENELVDDKVAEKVGNRLVERVKPVAARVAKLEASARAERKAVERDHDDALDLSEQLALVDNKYEELIKMEHSFEYTNVNELRPTTAAPTAAAAPSTAPAPVPTAAPAAAAAAAPSPEFPTCMRVHLGLRMCQLVEKVRTEHEGFGDGWLVNDLDNDDFDGWKQVAISMATDVALHLARENSRLLERAPRGGPSEEEEETEERLESVRAFHSDYLLREMEAERAQNTRNLLRLCDTLDENVRLTRRLARMRAFHAGEFDRPRFCQQCFVRCARQAESESDSDVGSG